MVGIAQLVRVSDCDSEGRGFEPHFPPKNPQIHSAWGFFNFIVLAISHNFIKKFLFIIISFVKFCIFIEIIIL